MIDDGLQVCIGPPGSPVPCAHPGTSTPTPSTDYDLKVRLRNSASPIAPSPAPPTCTHPLPLGLSLSLSLSLSLTHTHTHSPSDARDSPQCTHTPPSLDASHLGSLSLSLSLSLTNTHTHTHTHTRPPAGAGRGPGGVRQHPLPGPVVQRIRRQVGRRLARLEMRSVCDGSLTSRHTNPIRRRSPFMHVQSMMYFFYLFLTRNK